LQLVTEFLQSCGVRIPKFVEHCRNLSGRGRRSELITPGCPSGLGGNGIEQ
jgi:hypothetical protein